jgi:hypothetical protein
MSIYTALPLVGPVYGAKFYIGGTAPPRQPSWMQYIPPKLAMKTVRGKPIYQGYPVLVAHWNVADMQTYQFLGALFFQDLNSVDGPVVDILWPDPQDAAYMPARAYMQWPTHQRFETWVNDAEVRFSTLSYSGQGLFVP